MDLNPANYDYYWAVIVALIAATVALYGSWRANKISEKNLALSAELEIVKFREKWLWKFREEVSELNTLLLTSSLDEEERKKLFKGFNNVLLLMNPEDENFKELADLIARMMLDMHEPDEATISQPSEHKSLVILAQKIMKTEWEKLKEEIREISC